MGSLHLTLYITQLIHQILGAIDANYLLLYQLSIYYSRTDLIKRGYYLFHSACYKSSQETLILKVLLRDKKLKSLVIILLLFNEFFVVVNIISFVLVTKKIIISLTYANTSAFRKTSRKWIALRFQI